MERVNEQLYRANIDLVDKNRLLEEDKKILIKRINKTIEYINELKTNSDERALDIILKLLQGRYIENEN